MEHTSAHVAWRPVPKAEIEFRRAGTFSNTRDGPPLIGPVPRMKGLYAAYGYGDNGITFSFIAAEPISDLIAGARVGFPEDFALDSPG